MQLVTTRDTQIEYLKNYADYNKSDNGTDFSDWEVRALNGKKILITGFSGFVARYFVEYLCDNCKDVSVLGIDINEPPYELDLYEPNVSVSFAQVDMLDRDKLKTVIVNFAPDYIVHLAAFSSVAYSWKHPADSFMNNSNIFLNLIEIVKGYNIGCRILSVGSSEEYGLVKQEDLPLRENSNLNPMSPYAVARVSQEMLSKIFTGTYGMDIVLTRSFNHIGPRQDQRFVVPSFVKRILNIRDSGNKTGVIEVGDINIVRDFVDVRDVVRAYYMLLKHGRRGEVYNICSGVPVKLANIIEVVSQLTNVKVETMVNQEFIRPQDNAIIVGSAFKITSEVGWYPEIPLKKTLMDMITYFDTLNSFK